MSNLDNVVEGGSKHQDVLTHWDNDIICDLSQTPVFPLNLAAILAVARRENSFF